MKLDKNYKVPDGFETVLNYREDGVNGTPVVGLAKMKDPKGLNGRDLTFWIEKAVPVLPLKGYGLFWHRGWDIPTCWAIDGDGKAWMDDAHGGALVPVSPSDVVSEAETEEEKNAIRVMLGMEPVEPEWQRKAREAGWTPPKGSA